MKVRYLVVAHVLALAVGVALGLFAKFSRDAEATGRPDYKWKSQSFAGQGIERLENKEVVCYMVTNAYDHKAAGLSCFKK